MSPTPDHSPDSHDADHLGHEKHNHGSLQSYLIGFGLSVVLTAIPFWLVMSGTFAPQLTGGLIMIFAVAQIVVHMVFFLHMNTKSEGGWTILALIFTLILVAIALSGSLWVMYHLNTNMMPAMPTNPAPDGMPRRVVLIGALTAVLVAGFAALGVWQVQRLGWKQDLIRQVDARIHAPVVPAPGPDEPISREADQYRRVVVTGVFDHERETLTQAVTDLGPGFWVLTPMRTDRGFTVLINRGFVPRDRRASNSRAAGQVDGPRTVTGLLRITEPKGGFLRANDPQGGRWFSRDVAAIAAHRGLTDAVPYFIDADATSNPGGLPVGGLTVVRFSNSHLIYALTWFALALMAAAGGAWLIRDARRAL